MLKSMNRFISSASRLCLILVFILGAGFLSVKQARAATRTVCPSGCDYTTIAAAEAGATPGDTINVATGTYNENTPTFNKTLTWVAVDGNGTVTITNSGGGTYSAFITGSNISIQGFVFDALNTKAGTISIGAAATNNTFSSCTFRNPTTIHFALASTNTGWTISNSTFSGNAGNTDIIAGAAVNISGSSFTLPLRTSIDLTHTSGTSQIANNTFTADGGLNQYGVINIGASGTINITGNTFNLGQTSGLVSWPISDSVTGTGKTGTLNINGNTFNIYTSTTGRVISITKGQYAVTVGTSGNGNIFHLITSWPSSSTMVNIADQTTGPSISYNTVISDYSGTNLINWLRVYATSNASSYGAATITNNTLTMANPNGIGILVGTDGVAAAGDHKIAPSTIEYNTCTAPGTSGAAFHCIEYGYQNNGIIRFNKSIGAGFGIVLKGGADPSNGGPTDFSTGIVSYNIISEPLGGSSGAGIHIKGINNVKLYNNTIYASRTSYAQNGIWAIAYDSNNSTGWDFKNNIIYVSNNASSIGINVEAATQTGSQSNYNNIYKLGANGSIGKAGSTSYSSLSLWQGGGGYDINSVSSDSSFVNPVGSDFSLSSDSPVVDNGTDLGLVEDYLGNSIYGTPDMGAYEYQPPFIIGSNELDIDGDVRIYADGKFRNIQTPSGNTADISITPDGGFGTGDYSQWMDISISEWNTSGDYAKTWTQSSDTIGADYTVHTVGDLEPNGQYVLKVDNVQGANITSSDCTSGVCTANGSGEITFTYTGGYSTHTFNITEYTPTPTSSPGGSSGSSSSSSHTSSAPSCNSSSPVGQPDLFQIDRSGNTAKLYFTPVNDHVESYHIIFGFKDGDERFGGINMKAQNENQGVQSLVVDHLDPKANYSFKVVSVNGCAPGEWSNWLSVGRVQAKTSIFYRYWNQVRNLFR